MRTLIENTPRIYVGTYAKYNSGSIAGEWLDLDNYTDASDFYEACQELHKNEADPEFMFQDWENIPDGLIHESGLHDQIFDWVMMDDDERKLVTLYNAIHGTDDWSNISEATDRFAGTAETEADFSENLFYETQGEEVIPNSIVVDWEATWQCNDRHAYCSIFDTETGDFYFFYRD